VVGHVCRILSNCIEPALVVEPLFDMIAEYGYLSYPISVLLEACRRVRGRQAHAGLDEVLEFLERCVCVDSIDSE